MKSTYSSVWHMGLPTNAHEVGSSYLIASTCFEPIPVHNEPGPYITQHAAMTECENYNVPSLLMFSCTTFSQSTRL